MQETLFTEDCEYLHNSFIASLTDNTYQVFCQVRCHYYTSLILYPISAKATWYFSQFLFYCRLSMLKFVLKILHFLTVDSRRVKASIGSFDVTIQIQTMQHEFFLLLKTIQCSIVLISTLFELWRKVVSLKVIPHLYTFI